MKVPGRQIVDTIETIDYRFMINALKESWILG